MFPAGQVSAVSGRRALALRSFKEEAVLARVVRSPPTLSSQSITWSGITVVKDGSVLPGLSDEWIAGILMGRTVTVMVVGVFLVPLHASAVSNALLLLSPAACQWRVHSCLFGSDFSSMYMHVTHVISSTGTIL